MMLELSFFASYLLYPFGKNGSNLNRKYTNPNTKAPMMGGTMKAHKISAYVFPYAP